jgi:catechol 2,3-dioxygenase-like lactoylglutathione lyase family enzyme
MARIKHIAIRTPDPEKTAAFYKDVFGLKEVRTRVSVRWTFREPRQLRA